MQENKKKSTKKFRERERTIFLWEKTMHRIEEIVTNLYSKKVWIRRDKNKGRWRERGRMILM